MLLCFDDVSVFIIIAFMFAAWICSILLELVLFWLSSGIAVCFVVGSVVCWLIYRYGTEGLLSVLSNC